MHRARPPSTLRFDAGRDQSALKGKVQQDSAEPRWDAEYPVDAESTLVDPGDRENTVVDACRSAPAPKAPPPPDTLAFADVCEPVQRLRAERRWLELTEQYTALAERADDSRVKAAHYRKRAEIEQVDLEDPARAFETLLAALRLDALDPEDETALDAEDETALDTLEDLAALLRKLPEFLEAVEVAIYAASSDRRALVLLERAVHSAQSMLGEERRLDRYVGQIRALCPQHPAVERRVADLYAGCENAEAAHEALERARIRASSTDEKRDAHVALGRFYETDPARLDAARAHFVSAYELDRSALPPLEGLERVLHAMRKFGDAALVLERISAVATDKRTREGALLRLALVHEHKFQDPERALHRYQRVLTVNAENREARAGIDRCLERMHAWDELLHELRRRANLATDPREKAVHLGKLALLHEARLLDEDSAVKTWLEAYAVRSEGKVILFELARLSEKNADYPAAAAYRARLAQLTGDPDTRVRIYVGIARMLAYGERDVVAARVHYERAVAIDAKCLDAWEGLQELAENAGDDARSTEALTMRAELTEGAKERATLYLELADLLRTRDLPQRACEAYEKVLACDPENDTAARAVLREYTRQGRFRDALPLCELLMNAEQNEGSFELFDQGARLSLSCDDPARALTAAVAAYRIRPDDSGARTRVVDLAFRLRADAAGMALAKPALDRIAGSKENLGADALFKLAALALSRSETDVALGIFEHLLSEAPHHRPTLSRMGEIYMARGDWQRAAECKRRLAQGVESSEEKFKLLVETGEILAQRAQDYEGAAEDFETAKTLRPDDRMLLQTQLSVYKELGQWEKAVRTLRELADLEKDAKLKAKGIFAMAQVVENRIGDPRWAVELFDEVLALDPSRLDAFEHITRIHTSQRDWEALASVHHALLGRLDAERERGERGGDVDLRQNLQKRLGLIYRDRLVDAKRSLESFRAALVLREDDDECRRYTSDLMVVIGDLDGALELTMRAVRKNPMAIEPLNELYTLLLRKYDFDRAWCTLDVLGDTLLAKLSGDQDRFCISYPPTPLDVIPGTLVASAWDSHILHPDLDPVLTAIFRIVMPAVMRGTLDAVPRSQRETWLGTPVADEPSPHAYPLIRTFLDAAEVLGVSAPDLRIDRALRSPFAVAVADRPTLHVSMDFAQELSPGSLAFLAGKYIGLLQPELVAKGVFPSVAELESLLGAAMRIAAGTTVVDENELATLLGSSLTAEEMVALRRAASSLTKSPAKPDVVRWANLVDLSASRAGLLLAGSVESARRATVLEPHDAHAPGAHTTKEWLGELVLFAVSDTYAELRAALGVGVRTDEERAAFTKSGFVDPLDE